MSEEYRGLHTERFEEFKNVKCVVLDFDDTFMRGSEGMKRDAWKVLFPTETLYLRYIQAQEEVSKGNKGGRRYIIAQTLALPLTDPLVEVYENQFDAIVQEKIIAQGIHLDDVAVLKKLKANGYKVFLMSGTPLEALQRTLASLEERQEMHINTLFDGVLGQPNNKVQNFAAIQEQTAIPYNQMVKAGDSEADLNAAVTVGAHFIGVTTVRNKDAWQPRSFLKIDSLSELLPVFDIK